MTTSEQIRAEALVAEREEGLWGRGPGTWTVQQVVPGSNSVILAPTAGWPGVLLCGSRGTPTVGTEPRNPVGKTLRAEARVQGGQGAAKGTRPGGNRWRASTYQGGGGVMPLDPGPLKTPSPSVFNPRRWQDPSCSGGQGTRTEPRRSTGNVGTGPRGRAGGILQS